MEASNNGTALATLDQAVRMLAEIRTVADAAEIADIAAAAKEYAKRARLGKEAQNHAAEIHLRAQGQNGQASKPDRQSVH